MRQRHTAGLSAGERRTSIMRRTLLAMIAAGALLAAGLRGAHAFGHGGPGSCGRRRGVGVAEGPGIVPVPLLLSVVTLEERAQLGEVMWGAQRGLGGRIECMRSEH